MGHGDSGSEGVKEKLPFQRKEKKRRDGIKRGARELFIATLIKVSAPAHALLVTLFFLSLSLRHLLKGFRICYINVKQKIVTVILSFWYDLGMSAYIDQI